jgi:hypothetical protein
MNKLPKIALWLSVVTAVLGVVVSIFQIETLYLAGTQWFIIAILLAVWSHAFENCGCCTKKE